MRSYVRLAATLCAIALSEIAVRHSDAQSSVLSFGPPTVLDLQGTDVAGRVVADVNQDGHLDVIATVNGATSTNVKLAIGDGAGRFVHAPGFFFQHAGGAVSADFNGDGALDVAIAQNTAFKSGSGYGDFVCGSLIGVGVFLGPTLASARCLATVPSPVAIQAGDFDRDGRPDVAVVGGSSGGLLIYLHLNLVSTTIVRVPQGELAATSMAPPADVNGDGLLDLIVGHATGVTVFLGRGDGTFSVADTIASSGSVQAVAIGQLDADRQTDIAFIQPGTGRLFAAFGKGNGTFIPQPVATIGTDLTDVAIADLDRDGKSDLIVAHRGGGTIRIFTGNGDGTFVAETPLVLGSRPKFLVVSDLDADGDLDVGSLEAGVTGQNARLWVTLQNGTGTPDVTPPVVRLTEPFAGATLSGTVSIAATASDAGGISRVEFYAGGTVIGSDTTSPYAITWNTTIVSNGPYTLTARAYDLVGNSGTSGTVPITVFNDTTPSTPVELIVSGTFEPTVSGWTRTGATFFSTGGVPHSGVGYSYLAKANSVTGTLSQAIDLPASSNPFLSFWLNITSAEPSTTVASDTLSVEILSSTGVLLQTLATYSNLNSGPLGGYVLKGPFSLGAFAGQRVRLQFRAVTNAVNITAFRIDDVSVTAVVPRPPASGELMVSGGFEPTVTGWSTTGAAFFSTGGVQHSGIGYGYLAKANSVTGALSQTISVPAGSAPSLSFWLNVTSEEPSTTVASDRMFVEVLNSSGAVLATLATFSNLNKGALGAYVFKSGFSLATYAGQTVRLRFRATTDSVKTTAFRIDDVSVR